MSLTTNTKSTTHKYFPFWHKWHFMQTYLLDKREKRIASKVCAFLINWQLSQRKALSVLSVVVVANRYVHHHDKIVIVINSVHFLWIVSICVVYVVTNKTMKIDGSIHWMCLCSIMSCQNCQISCFWLLTVVPSWLSHIYIPPHTLIAWLVKKITALLAAAEF